MFLKYAHQPGSVPSTNLEKYDEAAVEAYETQLLNMPNEELAALVEEEKSKVAQEKRERTRREEEARFFNGPAAKSDLEHWSRASYWTIDEAVALALGREPKVVNLKNVKEYEHVSPFAERYLKLHELTMRAVKAKQLTDPTFPQIFLP